MMKKWMIIIVVSMSAASLTAQHITLGPTAGFGHGWISNDDNGTTEKNRFHPSYNVGAKLVYSIMSHWGVSADVKFSSEGGTMGTDNNNKTISRINYIRVPLQGIYFFGAYGDKVRPKISVGPSFGFVAGGKVKDYENNKVTSNVAIKDYLNKVDVGLNAAVGANIRLCKSTWLNTDITYYHGFTDITKAAGNAKLRGIGINVGVLFPIGTK